MIHPDVNYGGLLLEFLTIEPTPEARLAFCAKHLGGGATLGLMEAYHRDLNLTERGREALKLILTCEEGRKKTGVKLILNRAPGMLVTDPLLALLPSSSVLTYKDVLDVKERVKANAGCTIDVLGQPNRQKNKDCTGFHTEIIARPLSDDDGQPIALSVLLVPSTEGDWKTARQIIQQVVGCERLGPVDAEGDLPRAFCSPQGTSALGPDNMLLALRRDQWAGTLAEFTPLRKLSEAHSEPGHALPFSTHPTEFAMSFDADTDALSLFLQILALQEISIERGETLTFGSHYGFASCEAYAVTVLKAVFPLLFSDVDPAFLSLHKLTTTLAEKADRLYIAKKPDARIYDFGDDDKRDDAYEDVTDRPKVLLQRIEDICNDDNLNLQLTPEFPSWNNWFNNALAVPDVEDAKFLYLQFARAAITLLEEMAAQLTGKTTLAPAPAQETSPFADELIQSLEKAGSPWASLLQHSADPAVDKLMEAMRSQDARSIVDAMSLEDIRRNLSGKKPSPASREKWSEAIDQLEAVANVLDERNTQVDGPYPTADPSLGDQTTLDAFLQRRSAPMPDIAALTVAEDAPDADEMRRLAYEAIGILIDQNPTSATRIKAICLAIMKSVPDVGFALMFFWQVIRYAYSEDDGVTVSAGVNTGAVASYTLAQPALEVLTKHLALGLGAHREPVAPLPYPMRALQEYSYALKGGPFIGFLFKFINDIKHPVTGGGRLGWEFLAVIPGLLAVSADRILEDFLIFKQQYEILHAADPVRVQFKRALTQIVKDFLSIEHWVKKRLVTFIALYAHEWTARSWFYLFQNIPNPYFRSFVGAPQFGTFFVSFVLLTQLAEKLFDMTKPEVERLARQRRNRITDPEHAE